MSRNPSVNKGTKIKDMKREVMKKNIQTLYHSQEVRGG
jgi:hypothetical protein